MRVREKDFIVKLSNYLREIKGLEDVIEKFKFKHSLIPSIGIEIEFYLSKNIVLQEFTRNLKFNLKEEKGCNQFEIDLPPSTDLINYISEISKAKSIICETAQNLKAQADFRSKPYIDDYGSSLHFHVNFLHATFSGDNQKHQLTGKGKLLAPFDIDNDFLYLAARSICTFMRRTFLAFLPLEEDYLRIDKNFMAPTNVSFGGNNRTVAVRIPDAVPKRLEHRLSSPEVDPYIALFVILKSILIGLEDSNRIEHFEKIYGNAFDEQYNLINLPKSLEESIDYFDLGFFLKVKDA